MLVHAQKLCTLLVHTRTPRAVFRDLGAIPGAHGDLGTMGMT